VKLLPPEQYLEIERKEEWKNEYYQGEMRPCRFRALRIV
jgi:hypothetical protein